MQEKFKQFLVRKSYATFTDNFVELLQDKNVHLFEMTYVYPSFLAKEQRGMRPGV